MLRIVLSGLMAVVFAKIPDQNAVVRIITSGTATSLRGMSIATDKVIWVSGSNGAVGKSVDGGDSWSWISILGYEKRDFRDIEAFDSSTAIIMAVGNPACILKTIDGGQSWYKTFEKQQEGIFLDAMDFRNKNDGICIGDPLPSKAEERLFYILRTSDGGESWSELPKQELPGAQNDEAIFAASGTNISFLNHNDFEYAFVTGGRISNLYLIGKMGKKDSIIHIPLNQGSSSTGAFSLAVDKQTWYCVGGDYKQPHITAGNFYYSKGLPVKWLTSSMPPLGYKSCIRVIDKNRLVACGTAGVDLSYDAGKKWKNISIEGFNVCMATKSRTVFLAGENGKIAKIVF